MSNQEKICVTYVEDKLIVDVAGYPTHIYRIVDRVPCSYMIWNIPKHHMPEGYLPLCRLLPNQPFPGGRSIDTDSLTAIKTDGSDVILEAASYGLGTLEEAESFVRNNQDVEEGTYPYETVERAKKALPYMRQIKWD